MTTPSLPQLAQNLLKQLSQRLQEPQTKPRSTLKQIERNLRNFTRNLRGKPERKTYKEGQLDLKSSLGGYDIMLEVTSKCNLRCVYCPKSQPGDELLPGRDEHMKTDVFATLKAHAQKLADAGQPVSMLFNGTGETSFRKDWMELIAPILKHPGEYSLISNFGRIFSDDELRFLLNFDKISISIDTPNPDILKAIRRKVELKNIVYNITRLRAMALKEGRDCPELLGNCTCTDKAALDTLHLASFTATMRLNLAMNALYVMPPVEGQIELKCVQSLSDEDFVDFAQQVVQAIDLYDQHTLTFHMQATLEDIINARLKAIASKQELVAAQEQGPKEGQTRVCIQPWFRFTAAADGALFPCCVTIEDIGQINDKSVDEALNGPKAQAFREALLSADMPEVCKGCSNAPLGSPQELKDAIFQHWQRERKRLKRFAEGSHAERAVFVPESVQALTV